MEWGRAEGREGPDHAVIRASLSAWLDGLVGERDRWVIGAHLGTCASCRAYGRTLAYTVGLVRQLPWGRQPIAARERLKARLVAATRPSAPEEQVAVGGAYSVR